MEYAISTDKKPIYTRWCGRNNCILGYVIREETEKNNYCECCMINLRGFSSSGIKQPFCYECWNHALEAHKNNKIPYCIICFIAKVDTAHVGSFTRCKSCRNKLTRKCPKCGIYDIIAKPNGGLYELCVYCRGKEAWIRSIIVNDC